MDLFDAARAGDVEQVRANLADVHAHDEGDNASALHWAAACGHIDVVRLLVEAGADPIGEGDDHRLEVIGWATCFDDCHADVAAFLLAHGARQHIFSALALQDEAAVRALAPAQLERPMSHNEGFRRPLHFAIGKDLEAMVELLVALGADVHARDGDGFTATRFAHSPRVDRAVVAATGPVDLVAALALGDHEAAGAFGVSGALAVMAKRGDAAAVRWLLEHGADPDERWRHWDSEVTPLHMAILFDHADVVRLLLDAGADTRIRDSLHDSDAHGWAEFFGRNYLLC